MSSSTMGPCVSSARIALTRCGSLLTQPLKPTLCRSFVAALENAEAVRKDRKRNLGQVAEIEIVMQHRIPKVRYIRLSVGDWCASFVQCLGAISHDVVQTDIQTSCG